MYLVLHHQRRYDNGLGAQTTRQCLRSRPSVREVDDLLRQRADRRHDQRQRRRFQVLQNFPIKTFPPAVVSSSKCSPSTFHASPISGRNIWR